MGFWGTYIVARADQPLPGLAALRRSAESVCWHARGPGGWQAVQVHPDYQRRRTAALVRMHAVGPPAPDAAPLAVTWASEAGLQPDPAAVETALQAYDVFCEDVFFGLLAALGVPVLTSEDAGA